jgi:hypothetical protein
MEIEIIKNSIHEIRGAKVNLKTNNRGKKVFSTSYRFFYLPFIIFTFTIGGQILQACSPESC